MGSFGVVMFPPAFDDDLGFSQGVEDFAVQQFIPHSPVEAFTVSVFPRRAWLDVCGFGANGSNPGSVLNSVYLVRPMRVSDTFTH